MSKQILFLALWGCMVAPVAAQTVDVTLQCGQSYTINSTVAATAGATYRWLENGSTVTGTAANYTVPTKKSVGVYTYIRQAMSEGCTDWQNSNAFTVEVKNKNNDGVCINGLMWATRNVDLPGTFAADIDDQGKIYQFNRTTPLDPDAPYIALPTIDEPGHWSLDSNVCPASWRIPTATEWNALRSVTPYCGCDNPGLLEYLEGGRSPADTLLWVGPDACAGSFGPASFPLNNVPMHPTSTARWIHCGGWWTATATDLLYALDALFFAMDVLADKQFYCGLVAPGAKPKQRAYPIRCVQD